ncbi:hypothetical protein X744_29505 [Mesorhizobium sp. LNJC372A00]|nr:hypothetical protein X744_29505 [Mesorhizobium sp. LNJC372A00]
MKTDGRLDRNFLGDHDGDAINALLVPAGQNLRLIITVLALGLHGAYKHSSRKRRNRMLPVVDEGRSHARQP